ncbi:NUDIX hydrolase [Singulisphaera sp. PoT]|uniref:NUDIX hydrolase n=1 Tax=Singulisphaera sp. PoT TaxID=3411797 RepID=UPI003BF481A9
MSDPQVESSWVREPGEGDVSLEENWLFRLRRERYRSRESGRAHAFYVMHLADAVTVIASTPDEQVLFVRQFRAGSAADSLETPGGLVDPGEDALTAASRELLEETGYAGDPPILLGSVWTNPSILTSKTIIVLITNARKVADLKLDHGEELTVEPVPSASIPAMILDGRIDHGIVVCGLLWWIARNPGGPLAIAPA